MNDFYKDLIGNNVIEKELSYRGIKRVVFFKPLTAGQRVDISRGQRINVGGSKAAENGLEIDAGETLLRTHKFLAFCNVTADGKQIFKGVKEVGELPEDLVNELNALANEALNDEPEDLGND